MVKCERVPSVYKAMNEDLRNSEDEGNPRLPRVQRWLPFLRLLVTALQEEPLYKGTVLRGVQLSIDEINPGLKTVGFQFRWWQFSSFTKKGSQLNAPFVSTSGARVVFSLDCKSGVQIKHLSEFKKEEEVLMSPGALMRVKQVYQNGELWMVNLGEEEAGLNGRLGVQQETVMQFADSSSRPASPGAAGLSAPLLSAVGGSE
jgi:hypothetical protein